MSMDFGRIFKKKHFTNGAFFRITAVCYFQFFRISIHIFIIETKGLVFAQQLKAWLQGKILPCLDTGNRISSNQIWDTIFQGWILDSMMLVSTWILTKISSFEPCICFFIVNSENYTNWISKLLNT